MAAGEDGVKLGRFNPKDIESCASEWEDYKRRFEIHLDAKGLHDAQGRRKVGQLLKHMGSDHVVTYDSFIWAPAVAAVPADEANGIAEIPEIPAEDKYNLQTVFAKFDSHFGVHRYRNIKRQEFLSTQRQPGQSIMTFISDLRAKARYCDYGALEEGIIIDMVINRVSDAKCTERLMELDDNDLTMNNVIRICRQIELTQAHVKSLESKKNGESEVHRIRSSNRGRSRARVQRGRDNVGSRSENPHRRKEQRCEKCCRYHGFQNCRADNEFCGGCGQKGHFKKSPLCRAEGRESRDYYVDNRRYSNRSYHTGSTHNRRGSRGPVYRGRGQRRVHYAQDDDRVEHYGRNEEFYDGDKEVFEMCDMFDTMYCEFDVSDVNVAAEDVSDFNAILDVNGKPLSVELDTGARCNILSRKSLEKLSVRYQMKPSSLYIRGVHGKCVKAIGAVTLPCTYKGVLRNVEFQILDGSKEINLLGRTDCVNFGLIARINQVNVRNPSEEIVKQYKDVFDDEIGCLPGEYDIKVDESVIPVVHPPRPVPVALREKVKVELKRLEDAGIIKKVTEPTPWVNSMVVVSKKNSERVRICIDPTDLNKAIQREHFPMNNIDEIVTRLHGSTYYSTLDANMGYFQVKLTEKSSYLTTFNTPFGRFRNLRMPMGAKCSAEKFQSALVQAFAEIEGVEIYQDDILIHGKTRQEHDTRLKKVLETCRKINLKLNRRKCQIGKSEVNYVGHKLTAEGLKPTDERVKAISNLRPPGDFQELESILGMTAYVAKFIENLSTLTAPLRELKKEEEWKWTKTHQMALDKIKQKLTSNKVLKYFDVKKPLLISVDASSKGLGAAAIQEGAVIAYASRALTTTEEKYAQIEKEMLAVVYGCTKFHKLIYGKSDVTIESDHKPLESLLKKPMCAAPMRIQRMRLKLEPYTFNLIHTSGKSIGLADCLSRLPQDGEPNDVQMDDELMVCKMDTLAFKWHERIERATKEDPELIALKNTIFNGWPDERSKTHTATLPYWNFRDQLSTYNGIIYKGERIVIPQSLRSELLEILHKSHTGIVKTKQRAREMIYWPGLSKQIEEMSNKCEICLENRTKQQKEPMTIHPLPALPWNKVGTDLFEFRGVNYLLMVDYYSNFIEVIPLHRDTRSSTIIKHIKMNIARYGIMETLISDNGPQFISSEFEEFTRGYGINHITSSPTHQQSNGLAEEGVRQVKDLMRKCLQSGDDFFLALLDLRNSPRDEVIGSPMQRLQGRRAQTRLPIADSLLKPNTIRPDTVHEKMMQYRHKQKFYYDRGSKPLQPITTEKAVRVWTPNGWKPAEFLRQHQLPNSHEVRAGEQGRVYRRNRRHLMITAERPHRVNVPEPITIPLPKPNVRGDCSMPTRKPNPTSQVDTPPEASQQDRQTTPPYSPITRKENPQMIQPAESNRPLRRRTVPAKFKDYVRY